jgi:hypothetical protein
LLIISLYLSYGIGKEKEMEKDDMRGRLKTREKIRVPMRPTRRLRSVAGGDPAGKVYRKSGPREHAHFLKI